MIRSIQITSSILFPILFYSHGYRKRANTQLNHDHWNVKLKHFSKGFFSFGNKITENKNKAYIGIHQCVLVLQSKLRKINKNTKLQILGYLIQASRHTNIRNIGLQRDFYGSATTIKIQLLVTKNTTQRTKEYRRWIYWGWQYCRTKKGIIS